MLSEMSPIEKAKYACAVKSAEFVQDGMKVGLGTGSTAAWMVKRLGERVRDERLDIHAVATSTRTAKLAEEVGIKVTTLNDLRWLDLTIDGADEFDPDLNLIKGGGGAHLQEKVVAAASDRMIVIADSAKAVANLGAFPLPVEVLEFGWKSTRSLITEILQDADVLGKEITQRMNGDQPFITDEGNFVLDLHLKHIGNPHQLELNLNQIPGVVENGLFINICDAVVIGNGDGSVELRGPNGQIMSEGALDADAENIFADL